MSEHVSDSRPQVLDCTLRDGGYINQWDFSLGFARSLIRSLAQAGVDKVELGFWDPDYEGDNPWRNVSADTLARLSEEDSNARLSWVLLHNFGPGGFDPRRAASDLGGVDLVRLAIPKPLAREAIDQAGRLRDADVEVSLNFMAISGYADDELQELLDRLNDAEGSYDYVYLADSFGALTPDRTAGLLARFREAGIRRIGFHPHNNLQLAFANSLVALESGADIVDASVLGMGRGGGNLHLETWVAYLGRDPSNELDVIPVLQFAELFVQPLRERFTWGYSLEQMLSGLTGCHPNYPLELLKTRTCLVEEVHRVLDSLQDNDRIRFNRDRLEELAGEIGRTRGAAIEESPAVVEAARRAGKALLVGGGASINACQDALVSWVDRTQAPCLSINHAWREGRSAATFFGNRRRFLQHAATFADDARVVVAANLDVESLMELVHCPVEAMDTRIDASNVEGEPWFANSAIQCAWGLLKAGVGEVYLAGLDGYRTLEGPYFYSDTPDRRFDHEETLARLNEEILADLRKLTRLAQAKGGRFAIVTPTLFEDYYDASALCAG